MPHDAHYDGVAQQQHQQQVQQQQLQQQQFARTILQYVNQQRRDGTHYARAAAALAADTTTDTTTATATDVPQSLPRIGVTRDVLRAVVCLPPERLARCIGLSVAAAVTVQARVFALLVPTMSPLMDILPPATVQSMIRGQHRGRVQKSRPVAVQHPVAAAGSQDDDTEDLVLLLAMSADNSQDVDGEEVRVAKSGTATASTNGQSHTDGVRAAHAASAAAGAASTDDGGTDTAGAVDARYAQSAYAQSFCAPVEQSHVASNDALAPDTPFRTERLTPSAEHHQPDEDEHEHEHDPVPPHSHPPSYPHTGDWTVPGGPGAAGGAYHTMSQSLSLEDVQRDMEILFPTCMPEIDQVLVGLPSGSVVEVYGPPGSGKTHFGMTMCAAYADLGHRAMYVDLESSFSSTRLKDIVLGRRRATVRAYMEHRKWRRRQRRREKRQRQQQHHHHDQHVRYGQGGPGGVHDGHDDEAAGDDEAAEDGLLHSMPDVDSVLNNVLLVRDGATLAKRLASGRLAESIRKKRIRLVVIDSLPVLGRVLRELAAQQGISGGGGAGGPRGVRGSSRQRGELHNLSDLPSLMIYLKHMTGGVKAISIVLNQVVASRTRRDDLWELPSGAAASQLNQPALGASWSHLSNFRFALTRSNSSSGGCDPSPLSGVSAAAAVVAAAADNDEDSDESYGGRSRRSSQCMLDRRFLYLVKSSISGPYQWPFCIDSRLGFHLLGKGTALDEEDTATESLASLWT